MSINKFNGTTLASGTKVLGYTLASGAKILGQTISVGPTDPELLWWKLNDGSGTTIAAAVGPTGTTDGGWGTGVLDLSGFQIASSDSAINYGSTHVITIAGWVEFDDVTTTQILFESSANADSTAGAFLAFVDNGVFGVIVVVFDMTSNGTIKVYFGETLQSLTTIDNSFVSASLDIPSTQTLYLGNRGGLFFRLNAKLADFRIYSRELDATAVSALYAQGPQ